MKVLILGCGPAGLIAANAAVLAGAEVKILSKARKSFMKGAQYLHRPIPGIDCGEPFEIEYRMSGSPTGYRYKVYGDKWDGTVSPEDLDESHSGWDIRRAYDDLWETFGSFVEEWTATPASLRHFIDRAQPDHVFSSIPANLLCHGEHAFRASRIFSNDLDAANLPDNTVLCNGEEAPAWYRTSKIQGWTTTEWPDGKKPPFSSMFEVIKPLGTNCTCFPEVTRTGRYGRWEKGVLSHETHELVLETICPCTPDSPKHVHLTGGYAL